MIFAPPPHILSLTIYNARGRTRLGKVCTKSTSNVGLNVIAKENRNKTKTKLKKQTERKPREKN